jgi:hypothetical protein
MNVYDIEFNDFTGNTTRSILAKDMKEAANIADKMLKVALTNLWEDIEIIEIRFVCEITQFLNYVSEIEKKGKEIQEEIKEEAQK